MRKVQRRNLVKGLAYFNVVWNLLLFALNPAWGSIVLAWLALMVGVACTGIGIREKRRQRVAHTRHPWLFGGPVSARNTVVLGPGESLVALPNGWSRVQTAAGTHYVKECSHWPRDEVKLLDQTVVAYICRRCDHDWANEQYVKSGT